MSSGRLKASTNRVRTGDSLNSFWNNTIGVTSQLGANTAVEAYLNAPENSMAAGGGTGLRSSAARQQAAQDLVQQTGGFDSAVNNYESLLSLARSQGALGGQNRGACKRCGHLGHLTKQCRNPLAADGADGAAALAPVLPPMPEGNESESSGLSLSSSSGSGSDSDSESSGAVRRRKKEKKEKARKGKKKEERRRKKRHKEERRRKREAKKGARRKGSKLQRHSSSSSG